MCPYAGTLPIHISVHTIVSYVHTHMCCGFHSYSQIFYVLIYDICNCDSVYIYNTTAPCALNCLFYVGSLHIINADIIIIYGNACYIGVSRGFYLQTKRLLLLQYTIGMQSLKLRIMKVSLSNTLK